VTTQTDTSTTTTATAADPAAATTESGATTQVATENEVATTAATVTETPEALAAKAEAEAKTAKAEAEKAEKADRLAEVKRLAAQTRARYLETDAAKKARADADAARADAERAKTATQAEVDDLRAKLADAEKDPWAWAKAKGLTATQVAEAELAANSDDTRLKDILAKVEAANKRAEEAEKKAQAILDANKAREEQAQRVQAWETAKAAAVGTFEASKDKLADLHAWVDKQATKSGASKADVLVEEMLTAVNRIKSNPKTAPFAAEYTDAEILEAINARYEGYAKVNAPAPPPPAAKTSIAGATQAQAPQTAQAKDTKTGAPQESTGTAQKPAPTLTNAQASEQTATVRPEDFDSWSDRKQNAWLAEQLRKGTLT
jgi:hypothetical protein